MSTRRDSSANAAPVYDINPEGKNGISDIYQGPPIRGSGLGMTGVTVILKSLSASRPRESSLTAQRSRYQSRASTLHDTRTRIAVDAHLLHDVMKAPRRKVAAARRCQTRRIKKTTTTTTTTMYREGTRGEIEAHLRHGGGGGGEGDEGGGEGGWGARGRGRRRGQTREESRRHCEKERIMR